MDKITYRRKPMERAKIEDFVDQVKTLDDYLNVLNELMVELLSLEELDNIPITVEKAVEIAYYHISIAQSTLESGRAIWRACTT
jgi:hypothetical protein